MKNKALVVLGTNFEETEAVAPIDIMRRAGIEVVTLSAAETLEVRGAHGIIITADAMLGDPSSSDAGILVLPGGPGTKDLLKNDGVTNLVRLFASSDRYVAAICAAPMIPGSLGLLEGHRATCYPGFEQYLKGATVTGTAVEISGRFITGRGAGAALDFGFNIVATLLGKETASETARKMMAVFA
jgi:4-methyl-5(b-hydroxyethyl)-thiazole monophosphate biosynthesis